MTACAAGVAAELFFEELGLVEDAASASEEGVACGCELYTFRAADEEGCSEGCFKV